MTAIRRHLATMLALAALTATSVAGAAVQAPADAQHTRAAGMDGCVQSMAAAEHGGTGTTPHCPSTPMAASGPCGGPAALPVESRIELDGDSPADVSTTGPGEMRDLLLATPFFRPPIA